MAAQISQLQQEAQTDDAQDESGYIFSAKGRAPIPMLAIETQGAKDEDPLSVFLALPVDDTWPLSVELNKLMSFNGQNPNSAEPKLPLGCADLSPEGKKLDGFLQDKSKDAHASYVGLMTALVHQQDAVGALLEADMPEKLASTRDDALASLAFLGTALLATGTLVRNVIAEAQKARQVLYLETIGMPSKVAYYRVEDLACWLYKGDVHLFNKTDVAKIVQEVAQAGAGQSVAHASAVYTGLVKTALAGLHHGAHKGGPAHAGRSYAPSSLKAKTRKVFKHNSSYASGSASKKPV